MLAAWAESLAAGVVIGRREKAEGTHAGNPPGEGTMKFAARQASDGPAPATHEACDVSGPDKSPE